MIEALVAPAFEPENEFLLACSDMQNHMTEQIECIATDVTPSHLEVSALAGRFDLGGDHPNKSGEFVITKTAHLLDTAPTFIFTRISKVGKRASIIYRFHPLPRGLPRGDASRRGV